MENTSKLTILDGLGKVGGFRKAGDIHSLVELWGMVCEQFCILGLLAWRDQWLCEVEGAYFGGS